MTDFRKRVEEEIDALTQEEVRAIVRQSLGAQKKVWRTIRCKHCERQGKYEVDVPVPNASKAVKDLGEFTKGKVPERHVVDVKHWIGRDYSEWPEEALRAVASGEVIEEGEFEPVRGLPERSSG